VRKGRPLDPDLLAFAYHARPGTNPGRMRHTHDHHEWLYCTAGSGVQLVETGEEGCRAGDLFFFPAGREHMSHSSARQEFRAVVVSMKESLFSPAQDADRECLSVLAQLKRDARDRCRVALSPEGSRAAGRHLGELLAEFESRRPGHSCAAKLRMMELLVTVLRDSLFVLQDRNALVPLSHQALVQQVLWYLEMNYMDPVAVDDVLAFCPMSRSHFHAVFREVTGRTLITALREIRVGKARDLLRTTERSILEISMECGFGGLSHFCHTFKALTGVSPGQWRKNHGRAPARRGAPGR
jgi:AraC-like DNA-binding protein